MAQKISSLLIGLLLVGLFSATIGLIIATGSSYYTVAYDNTTFNNLSYINQINATANQLQAQTQNISATQSNAFDVVGTLFNQGYTAASLTFTSIGFMYGLLNTAGNMLGIGGPVVPYIIIVVTLIVVLSIIFILLRTILKVDI